MYNQSFLPARLLSYVFIWGGKDAAAQHETGKDVLSERTLFLGQRSEKEAVIGRPSVLLVSSPVFSGSRIDSEAPIKHNLTLNC